MPTMIEANVARLVVRSLNSRSGMTGSFARISTMTAATSSSTPRTIIQALVNEAQSKSCPASETQIRRVETPPVISSAPR